MQHKYHHTPDRFVYASEEVQRHLLWQLAADFFTDEIRALIDEYNRSVDEFICQSRSLPPGWTDDTRPDTRVVHIINHKFKLYCGQLYKTNISVQVLLEAFQQLWNDATPI